MLGVGIHENVGLTTDTKVNEKGSLELHFGKKAVTDLWASLEAGDSVKEDTSKIIVWPINMTTWDGNIKSANQIVTELQALEKLLRQILKVYITTDIIEKYQGGVKMFDGLVFEKEKITEHLLDETFVQGAQKNIITKFIEVCNDNDIFDNDQTFRLKLIRQGKDKHFPKIPASFDTWIESSIITKEKSKIVWSKYEKDNGLDSGEPTAADPQESKQEVADVNHLFGDSTKDTNQEVE